ncbi:uncharacterized protein BDR25DRAFT_284676 [Lindgomyces ingoldianus]|uniref:Uncharacterized protein n=1 Tax=Lindgomyces ingoldianus TaxID=673940 RepID=A0ACB6R008_9PLEO|nr:uncharacterized protein BDR25DRAFT_284676 [Lindgomyces ingoldianus]KAF2472163.1 hypothetical protein BDR25DRAFT_284676 [Lindgomyces ingoldianus]
MTRTTARIASSVITVKANRPPPNLTILRKLEKALANDKLSLENKKWITKPYYQALFKLSSQNLASEQFSVSWVRQRYVEQETARRERQAAKKVDVINHFREKRQREKGLRALATPVIRFGEKEVFLPKAVIALLRTPNLSPFQARFHVPLNFSKFDLRDYLYHGYGVKAINITSYVEQQPVQDHVDAPRRWFRPTAKKFMTIDMDSPFVWPEDPKSWAPWGKKEKDEEVERNVDEAREPGQKKGDKKMLKNQALELLRGKVQWEPTRSPLQAHGEYKIRV